MTKEEVVEYWISSSDEDFRVMTSLYTAKHYSWSLFVGHLVVEKLLKAYYVARKDEQVPRIHNLLKIAEEAGLTLTDQQRRFLDETTTFNIRARYPDYKNRFAKTANAEFTSKYLEKIAEFRSWLRPQMKE